MAQINRNNYEEFYLDYLEGNLSADLAMEMEVFLLNHPDLAIDNDLPSFSHDEGKSLDETFKKNLKVSETDAAISDSTIDDWLIADIEGQLSTVERKSLRAAVAQNKEWQKAQRMYTFTQLKPDLSEIYSGKNQLKKGRVIALKPVVSLLAAASVISFIWLMLPDENHFQLQHGALTAGVQLPKISSGEQGATPASSTSQPSPTRTVAQATVVTANTNFEVDRLSVVQRKERELPAQLPKSNISPRPLPIEVVPTTSDQSSYSMTLKDQAKPITRALSDVIKQEVVYQKSSNDNPERSGFYIKIGKFELYSNRKVKPKD